MGLKIYNSLTNKLEDFIPIHGNKVNMYVCGPTVYNIIHIGNARPVVFYDMLKNYLKYLGYDVTYASNITDVDDKIINKALEENVTEKEIATRYEKEFFKATEIMGSKKPDIIPHATDYINEMIDFIKRLIDAGYAYQSGNDVFFRISKLKDYGILSNQVSEELEKGARVEINSGKENPLDFTLWKNTTVGIKWDSPFGKGRPGWHTECVVMNKSIFKGEIDIHGGGMDLKFPHHENEIAQSEALYNDHLAKYWMHVGRLDLKGEKMSKSLGNCIYVKDFDTKEKGMIMRSLLVFSPYRANISYSQELFNQYEKDYTKWQRAYKQALYTLQYENVLTDKKDKNYLDKFEEYMNQDLNVQNVLMLVNDIVKDLNTNLRSKNYENTSILLNTFKCILDVMGINLFINKMNDDELSIYKAWQKARLEKKFDEADIARSKLEKLHIL